MKKLIKYFLVTVVVIVCAATGTYYYAPGVIIKISTGYAKWKGGVDANSIQIAKHNWSYLEAGSKNNEAIVFLHGFALNKESWIGMMNYFGNKYHVIAPDLPGFGENKIAEGAGYTIPDQVYRLDKFLSAIGVDKFHLIGASMGGYISAHYAAVHQDKLLSLALISSAGVMPPRQSYYVKRLAETKENLLFPEDVEGFKKMLEVVYHDPPKIPDHFAAYFIEVRNKRLKEEKRLFQGIVKSLEVSLEARLPLIEAQTLIIWGDKDRVTDPSSVAIFEKGLKNHKTVIFKNVGHVPFKEAPGKTNEAYERFLTNL